MVSKIYFKLFRAHGKLHNVSCCGIGTWSICLCVLLSISLHCYAALSLQFGDLPQVLSTRIALVDIILAPSIPPPEPVQAPSFPPRDARSEDPRPVAKKPPLPAIKAATSKVSPQRAKPQADMSTAPSVEQFLPQAPATAVKAEASAHVPALFITNATPTILANESGQDSLKHGSEARFMHGVATEEFVEENYIGEYTLGASGRVWIEDDRKGSGHLILHAEHMNFIRPLFRFNRFIYVYGENADSPSPILGSVTFFSDGYEIHQFLWQHNSTKAYFPRRR